MCVRQSHNNREGSIRMEDVTLQEFAEMCQQNTCPTCPMWRGTVNVPDNCCPVQMGMKAPEASAIVRRWQAEKCGDNN